ncbi:hypothetical protein QR680_009015 [Steinernema hermaphroditum]|uniref:Uncharacterized protein n=1 Tax=Steinernema hermaphroditum TaxID=289476 RepID=A0AA39M8N7_9BILA|nr:hypothetical protein QR680_009015 [Steinernema hermaphroditum]
MSSSSRSSSLSSLVSSAFDAVADHFWPSLGVLFSVAVSLQLLLIPAFPSLLRSLFVIPIAAFLYQWYGIHGHRFARETKFSFDEPNILATTVHFECEEGPMLGDDVTPGGTKQPVDCCGKGKPRESIFTELTRNEEKELMQKIYEKHYGRVYTTQRRREAERKQAEEKKS